MTIAARTNDHGSQVDRTVLATNVILWLLVASLGAALFFWDGLISLGAAWAKPEYSYGPLVPLITSYMTLLEINRHPVKVDHGPRTVGLVIFFVSILIGFVGNLVRIPDIITYGFILYIGALILLLAGTRQGFRFWPGWLHLIFMLPLPQFIYLKVSTDLQAVSAELGVAVIQVMNIPVYLDGTVIDLGEYKLLVAEACSGLRYLFPLFSFGWLMAVLYNGPNWHRVLIFLATIPVTVLMNSFRVGMIGVLVNYYGIEQAEGFIHFFEGWIIFIACTVILYLFAWILSRHFSFGRKRPKYIIGMDYQGMLGPLKKLPSLNVNRPFMVATICVLAAGIAWQMAPRHASDIEVDRLPLGLFPLSIDGRQGVSTILDSDVERVLGADEYLVADYSNNQNNINLLLTYYDSQTHGSGIHSPEVCLPGGGWEVSDWKQKPVGVATGEGEISFTVNRAVIQLGLQRQLVYYWFEQRGRRIVNDFEAKFVVAWDSVLGKRTDGGLVRLVTPIGNAESEAEADERLQSFMNEIVPELPSYFPALD